MEPASVIFQRRFSRVAVATLGFMSVLAFSGPLAAQTRTSPSDDAKQAPFPSGRDLLGLTVSGSYLAARHASVDRDATAASAFYRAALHSDPKNGELLDRAFIASLAEGNIDEAVKLANRILAVDKNNRVARLVVGVNLLKQKRYAAAQQNINQSVRGPITDLVATLLSGWASYGAGLYWPPPRPKLQRFFSLAKTLFFDCFTPSASKNNSPQACQSAGT